MEFGSEGQVSLGHDLRSLETVRALHQTVISLRVALEQSRAELHSLRSKFQTNFDQSLYTSTIEKLSLENHILRQRALSASHGNLNAITNGTRAVSASHGNLSAIYDVPRTVSASNGNLNVILDVPRILPSSNGNLNSILNVPTTVSPSTGNLKTILKVPRSVLLSDNENLEASPRSVSYSNRNSNTILDTSKASFSSNGNLKTILHAPPQIKVSMEPDTVKEKESEQVTDELDEVVEEDEVEGYDERDEVFETDSDNLQNGEENKTGDEEDDNKPKITKGESEDSEEVDDIELIFTTEDTKELSALQEDLVSIAETDCWPSKGGGNDGLDGDTKKRWTHSVLVETDISKCGIFDENDEPHMPDQGRRYTLPDPAPHRPIIRTLSGSRSQLLDCSGSTPQPTRPLAVKFMQHNNSIKQRTARPILVEKETSKQESEAQTDITALPAHWRSESYLAHKVSYQFTTLPSKFAFPVQTPPRKHSLKLCEKTQEARRVLLSDINFTSMVPELSRSADHLCNNEGVNINASMLCKNYPRAFSYMKNPDVMCSGWSPCECTGQMSSWDCYRSGGGSSMLSMMQSPSAQDLVDHQPRRRHSMRPSTSSTDTCWGSMTSRGGANWSVPSSPTHCRRSRSIPLHQDGGVGGGSGRRSDSRFMSSSASCGRAPFRKARNRVTFQEGRCRRPGQSLPDLRLPLEVADSGEDSTDSLIEESEDFLRQSIDSMLTGARADYSHLSRHRRKPRRHSDPDPITEYEPPKSAQPFLARVARDLKLDYWVKVIGPDGGGAGGGRVVVGRVKYVGPLPGGRTEPHVGVRLPRAIGNSDGTVDGRRFFDCEPDHAVFVPFKKVVMAWSN
ncbi:uncharacterized protein LOC111049194 [Nilaparvata lugens]|uniref:uncharacterized protein LOC111061908 n=1 Tax=Nilaparvata lugens TaxID=108931 RepID=UPI00193E9927|nr:uncharacterized protein LOC111061908 [Nilaparvata lugens]XP_039293423.1 uncharacterized protein LOC111061908 [Nilaparvata lugens]XP_039293467.1 uncharacterized protein LOC111049194 [Nilaparvata lugens]